MHVNPTFSSVLRYAYITLCLFINPILCMLLRFIYTLPVCSLKAVLLRETIPCSLNHFAVFYVLASLREKPKLFAVNLTANH